MTLRHVAVVDIGKTNAKLALVDLATLAELAVVTRPNAVRPGPPWPHFDIEGHWRFLLDALARFHAAHRVDAISVTTHGAAAVLLDRHGGLAAPVLDYEHPGPDTVAAEYDAIRPAFAETGSPRLPLGLNLGAQFHWQFGIDPGLPDRAGTIVTYPQYWSHRLTGVAATDVSSLGCHTDLWQPRAGAFSSLVETLGIGGAFAAPRRSSEILGPIRTDLARKTGLAPATPVVAGIHDSNASLYGHLIARAPPFAVVSTGTWVIAMAVGGAAPALDPNRDTLINVDARGRPVPSARFMGGREYEILGARATPQAADIDAVLRHGAMLLPAVEPGSGPFRGRTARWIGGEPPPGSGERAAAVAFYLALMTAECLDLAGHRGPVVVEGAFARNATYLAMLAAATGARIEASASATGASAGAALLFADRAPAPVEPPAATAPLPGGADYARRWRAAVAAPA